MQNLFQLLETVSHAQSTILISGETGTGKELVARAIHHGSPRHQNKFVALNCAAIPETLLEAELFGHVRGAYTGAVANRPGRFEQADHGTLFLDEVGETPDPIQPLLLRALETGEIQSVGGQALSRVDVRLISATDAHLELAIEEGRFRQSLLHRLAGYTLTLPPLRARR